MSGLRRVKGVELTLTERETEHMARAPIKRGGDIQVSLSIMECL